jgi:hypothetical protein
MEIMAPSAQGKEAAAAARRVDPPGSILIFNCKHTYSPALARSFTMAHIHTHTPGGAWSEPDESVHRTMDGRLRWRVSGQCDGKMPIYAESDTELPLSSVTQTNMHFFFFNEENTLFWIFERENLKLLLEVEKRA